MGGDMMKMLICSCLLVVALAAIAGTKEDNKRLPQDKPIQMILREMAKGDGISESEARAVATEVCVRLWGSDEFLKVHECKLDENGERWAVFLHSDNGPDGWGCTVWILKSGHLEKAEYAPGL
jgi:hypothetical protein